MAHEMQHMPHVGGKPFNHSQSQAAEQEYDRLRDLARREADKRAQCMEKSQQAYQRGDGAAAHSLSEEGKAHGRKMAEYNKQASDFIFRENNAPGRVAPDTIDLHGQFVEEAEDIVEQRIRYARAQGQSHLHVIVGRGNHSPGHIQKIKPKVEQVCREMGLQYHTEPNEGRIYVDLTGGAVDMSQVQGWQGYQQGYQNDAYAGAGQGPTAYPHGPPEHHYAGAYYQGGGGGGAQQQQNEEIEKLARKFLPRIFRFLKRLLCN